MTPPSWAWLPPLFRPRPLAAAIRVAVVVPAVVATVLLGHPPVAIVVVAVLATFGAIVRPGLVGTSALLAVELVGWIYVYGVNAHVSLWRTIVFAVVLYLAYTLGALGAAVPVAAHVDPRVLVRWSERALPGVASGIVAGFVVDLIGHPGGSRVLDVVGLAAATVAVALFVWLLRSVD